MASGLQIWSGSGQIMLDTSARIGRIKGMAHVTGSAGSMGADLSDGVPWWSFQPDFLFAHISNETPPPIVSINSGGVSWTYSSTAGMNYPNPITGWIFFGVY